MITKTVGDAFATKYRDNKQTLVNKTQSPTLSRKKSYVVLLIKFATYRQGRWYDLGCTGSVYYVCETATGIDPCEKGTTGGKP
jgi:hypothetical protein